MEWTRPVHSFVFQRLNLRFTAGFLVRANQVDNKVNDDTENVSAFQFAVSCPLINIHEEWTPSQFWESQTFKLYGWFFIHPGAVWPPHMLIYLAQCHLIFGLDRIKSPKMTFNTETLFEGVEANNMFFFVLYISPPNLQHHQGDSQATLGVGCMLHRWDFREERRQFSSRCLVLTHHSSLALGLSTFVTLRRHPDSQPVNSR